MIRATCTCFSTDTQLFKVIHCVCCILDNQLNCPPFQIVFAGIANITSTPIRWEGGGWVGSQEVAGKGYVFSNNSQITIIGAIFTSTCHTKQPNPWTNSLASCVMIHSRLFACQGNIGPFESWLKHLWTSDRLRNDLDESRLFQLSVVLNTSAVGPLMQLTNGDEKCVLKLCIYKTLLANLVTYCICVASTFVVLIYNAEFLLICLIWEINKLNYKLHSI